jgi:hypothetical protein
LLKIAQNVAQPIFFVKTNTYLLPWTKVAHKFCTLLYLKRTAQRKQSTSRRKLAQSGHPAHCCEATVEAKGTGTHLLIESMVTRLGEFSPVGQLFTWVSLLKITIVHSAFLGFFFPRLHKSYALLLTKKCVFL